MKKKRLFINNQSKLTQYKQYHKFYFIVHLKK